MTPAELEKLIDRYIAGEVTADEKDLIDNWYNSYPDDKNDIRDEDALKAEIYAAIVNKIYPPAGNKTIAYWMRYAAAAVILLVSVIAILRKNLASNTPRKSETVAYTLISTKNGQVKKVNLPDGSLVWINANTTLRIAQNFQDEKQRYVYLDEGEAFFEVTKNPKRPFLVKTPHIITRVLGTSFNVRAYSFFKQSSVTVRTGLVQVNDSKRQLAKLPPNTQINYNEANGRSETVIADGSSARMWTEGKLVFTQATFNDLAFAIANTYGVKLISRHKNTAAYRFNIKINTQRSLDETMLIICSVHHNTYRRKLHEIIVY